MKCPRRDEVYSNAPVFKLLGDEDSWKNDDTCSYCGSLNPDTFMRRLEAGDISLGATDKNYKVYVHNEGGEPFKQAYRTDSLPFQGHDSKAHDWVTRDTEQTKFYFMHLSEEQMRRFVELYNEKKLKYHGGFRFYVFPYFMQKVG